MATAASDRMEETPEAPPDPVLLAFADLALAVGRLGDAMKALRAENARLKGARMLVEENMRLREQLAAYEAQWGTLYARRSSGL